MNLKRKYENYNWLWKMRTVFDKLNDSYAKYYSASNI
jgi:hypothetical protein